jgi:hypothetical protein
MNAHYSNRQLMRVNGINVWMRKICTQSWLGKENHTNYLYLFPSDQIYKMRERIT